MVLPIRDLNPTTHPIVVNWLLIAVCIGVFIVWQPQSDPGATEFLFERATIPCEITTLEPLSTDELRTGVCEEGGADQVFPDKSVLLSLITSIFLHAGWFHLLSNMWILWIFGNNIEDSYGHAPYLLFYLLAGVVASLAHILLRPESIIPVVGASGAIAGVMGSYLVLHPTARVVSIIPPLFFFPFRVPAFLFLTLWFVGQFFIAGQGSNVAWEAHVAGFIVGVVAGLMYRARQDPPNTHEHPGYSY
ncbi:MAG: rhomboid family intramembrane serine protease [Acidimicrobiia bacterium]|nr:rhomboid family intramembrane serine protease [Acidimicrobiia bacterium]